MKSEDINYLIRNYLEVHGFHDSLGAFERPDADTYKSFLMNKRDFGSEDIYHEPQPDHYRPVRKATEDLIGLELSRLESIDFWTPEPKMRKASTYSNSGTVERKRSMAIEVTTDDLVQKRHRRLP